MAPLTRAPLQRAPLRHTVELVKIPARSAVMAAVLLLGATAQGVAATSPAVLIAKAKPVLGIIDSMFPDKVGATDCKIGAGGPAPGGYLAGRCIVRVNLTSKPPTVWFREEWSNGQGLGPNSGYSETTYVVAVGRAGAYLVLQRGAVPPEDWS